MAGLSRANRLRRRRRTFWKAKGRCPECHRRVFNGFVICLTCRKEYRKYDKARVRRARQRRICVSCGGRLYGRSLCRKCLLNRYRWEHRLKRNRRLSGLCTECGCKRESSYLTCYRCRTHSKSFYLRRRRKIRGRILARYGKVCRCCGTSEPFFLNLDHVENDGKADRQKLGNTYALYEKLLKLDGVSPRYQLLCWNCNMAKAHYGICPHKSARRARGPALRSAPGRRPAPAA